MERNMADKLDLGSNRVDEMESKIKKVTQTLAGIITQNIEQIYPGPIIRIEAEGSKFTVEVTTQKNLRAFLEKEDGNKVELESSSSLPMKAIPLLYCQRDTMIDQVIKNAPATKEQIDFLLQMGNNGNKET